MLTLAIGPKLCKLELKKYKNEQVLGRISFDFHMRQVDNLEIILQSLTARLNGKHDVPLYVQFKGNSSDFPVSSSRSVTSAGRYYKNKNLTQYIYSEDDDIFKNQSLELENVSLEDIKSSTLQVCLFYDKNYGQE